VSPRATLRGDGVGGMTEHEAGEAKGSGVRSRKSTVHVGLLNGAEKRDFEVDKP